MVNEIRCLVSVRNTDIDGKKTGHENKKNPAPLCLIEAGLNLNPASPYGAYFIVQPYGLVVVVAIAFPSNRL